MNPDKLDLVDKMNEFLESLDDLSSEIVDTMNGYFFELLKDEARPENENENR